MSKTLTTLLLLSGVGIIVFFFLRGRSSGTTASSPITGTTGSAGRLAQVYDGFRNILVPSIGQTAVNRTGDYITAASKAFSALPSAIKSWGDLWGNSSSNSGGTTYIDTGLNYDIFGDYET